MCVPAACALWRTSERRVAETARSNGHAVLGTVQRAARSPVIADDATAAYALVRIVFVPRFASVNLVDVSCGSTNGNWFARSPSKTGCGCSASASLPARLTTIYSGMALGTVTTVRRPACRVVSVVYVVPSGNWNDAIVAQHLYRRRSPAGTCGFDGPAARKHHMPSASSSVCAAGT